MRLLPPAGPARTRQLVMLGAVVVLLSGVVWYGRPKAIPGAPASNSPAPAVPQLQSLPLPEALKLDSLTAVPGQTDVGRNPFGFGVKPLPPPAPISLPVPQVTAPPPPPPPVAQGPQGPPPITLKLIGLVQVDGRTRAMLMDPVANVVYQGFEGDVLDGRYRVVKIGLQSVVMAYVDGSGQRTIPIGG